MKKQFPIPDSQFPIHHSSFIAHCVLYIATLFLFCLSAIAQNPLLKQSASGGSVPIAIGTKEQANEHIQKQSVHFLENRGQMTDMEGKPVPFVLFKAEAPNVNLWLTETGITLQTIKAEEKRKVDNEKEFSNRMAEQEEETEIHWERVDIELQGASIKKENIIKEKPSQEHFNFFYSHCSDGIYGVKEYEKITIKDVYPGIDWVFYNSTKKGFKYDFVVHPGADPNQIKLVYSSKEKLNITENGELQVCTSYGNLTEQSPETFLDGKLIESRFKKFSEAKNSNGGYDVTIGFALKQWSNSLAGTLIIDPQLHWATFFGGSMSDGPVSITTDKYGNVFVTGYTTSQVDFPVQNTGTYYQGTNFAYIAAFIMKFDNAGVLLWATYYGTGVPNDQVWGESVAADATGNIYITGYTTAAALPTQNPGGGAYYQGTSGGNDEAFILKFDNSGNRIWATYYGGSGADRGHYVTTDASGNLFVTGYTASNNFPTKNAGTFFQGTVGSASTDAFILKFDNSGKQLWATYYGGNYGNEKGQSLAIDASGNVFVAGEANDRSGFPNMFPTYNPGGGIYFQGTNGGTGGTGSDAFILKFDNAGNRLWATYYGGDKDDAAYSIIADNSGNIFITGKTASANFPTQNAGTFFQATNGGGSSPADAFILKFDNAGHRLWATYYGGNGDDYSINYFFPTYNLALDLCGNVYVSFETQSTNMTTLAGCDSGYVHSFNGGYDDQFISLFTNTGTLLWATYLGGSGSDHRAPIATDKSGNLFVSGEWANIFGGTTVIPATYPLTNPGGGAFYSSYTGQDDGFMVKFCSNTCLCSSFSGCVQSVLPHAIFISSDTIFCSESGKCIDFFDHSINNPTSWKWSFPGATPDTSAQQNPTNICYYSPGTYPVTLVVTNSNGSDSITVSPMITLSSGTTPPVVILSNDTLFSSHGATYQWYLNGSPIAGATDSFYVCNQSGTYSVRITDLLGCSALSNGVYNSCITGVNQFGVGSSEFGVYPNPAGRSLNINHPGYSGLGEETTLEIYNVLGEIVYSRQPETGKPETFIDIQSLTAGVYFIKIKNDKKIEVIKFIKQ